MEIYVVNPGDTVDSVAQRYGVQTESILYANQIPYPYELAVGQALLIPNGQEAEELPYPFFLTDLRQKGNCCRRRRTIA